MRRKAAFFLAAAALATAVMASGSAAAQQAVSQHNVQVRDQLIANQENLLNTYRCLFGVDVHAVPGGCEDPDSVVVGAAPQNPTQGDLDVRDMLIQNQEALLNLYRCQFDVDTQLVPGGCSERAPVVTPEAGPVTTPEAVSFTIPQEPRGDDTLISTGRDRTCAVRVDGGVACWGQHGFLDRFALAGLQDVAAITTADNPTSPLHACVLHRDGSVSCWGNGRQGRLGQGDVSRHYLPVKVPGIADAVAVSAGSEHTCTLHRDGGVSCWGGNSLGQMGLGTKEYPVYLPRRVPGLSDVVMIAAGSHNNCAVHRDGDVSCWGWPYELSDSGPKRFTPPVRFASVSAGWSHSCARSVAGDVYCWSNGQSPAIATRVQGLTGVVEVSVGNGSTCTLHRDGGVFCWGRNTAGEVGDGTTTPRQRPKRVADISNAVAVSVSWGSKDSTAHACVLRSDGSALCWGGNETGQLGDGTNTNRLNPTPVKPIVVIPADQASLTPTLLLRTWTEAVVQEHEENYPWMRIAWDEIRDRAMAEHSGYGGQVRRTCYASADALGCKSLELSMTAFEVGGIVHELLHVYDLHTGLAPPKTWGAVQLYFATTYPGCYNFSGDISGAEILADTVNHLIVPGAWLTYYESTGCPNITPGSSPTTEAEQVVLQGLSGQVPDWYRENITNGAELWAAWLRGPSLPALANLADEFGGLCSTDWITYPLDPELFPPVGSNPFRDGGCP
ncbi:RCC1 domain-containing protein [Candidatus Poriferisocius sp.]|uniref:RCC1 domain-containing protein n=1 Tax=Candidatus Poriferisocius sp. TaxID=3101276 RepID=UPI003B012609